MLEYFLSGCTDLWTTVDLEIFGVNKFSSVPYSDENLRRGLFSTSIIGTSKIIIILPRVSLCEYGSNAPVSSSSAALSEEAGEANKQKYCEINFRRYDLATKIKQREKLTGENFAGKNYQIYGICIVRLPQEQCQSGRWCSESW